MVHPNPEVYRLDAEYITSRGDCKFSCNALTRAMHKLGVDRFDRLAYIQQYQLTFGPYKVRQTFAHYFDLTVVSDDLTSHPFWNKRATPWRQEMRRLALLLMADIVEQGSV